MALNLTNLFTALGRIGHTAYTLNVGQDNMIEGASDLFALTTVNPAWAASAAATYDAGIRLGSAVMTDVWTTTAINIVQGFVLADNPAYGSSIGAALEYVRQQMITQAASISEYVVSTTVTADAANDGTGVLVTTVLRADGLTVQNAVPEEATVVITDDSYSGSAVAGQEPWLFVGAPAVSSLGTGTPVTFWDWDWPRGSAATAAGNAVMASEDATEGGNYLTNGDFEDWTGSAPAVLDSWYLRTGTWGTSIQRSTAAAGLDGGYAVQFNVSATLNTIEQNFNSDVTDGSLSTAGTNIALPAYSIIMVNFWTQAAGVVSGGVMTVSLVNGSGAGSVVTNAQGVNQSQTLALTGLSTSWTARSFTFQTPTNLSQTGLRLRIAITTAVAGAAILVDDVCLTTATTFYPGGPAGAIFSNPATPFVAAPDPDAWTVDVANNFDGALHCASFQSLFARLFQTPALILPYSNAPTQADTLITTP